MLQLPVQIMFQDDELSKAKWIWCEEPCENTWVWARKSFESSGENIGQLLISADLRYLVWFNGQRIGFGPPKFHFETPTLDQYDISAHIKPGINIITVCVYSLGNQRISSCSPRRGALLASIQLADIFVVTDSTWKVARDEGYNAASLARRGEMQPPSECYDARCGLKEPWLMNYDDSHWPVAKILEDGERSRLEIRDIPAMSSELYMPDRLLECGLAHFSKAYQTIGLKELAIEMRDAEVTPIRDGCVKFDPALMSSRRISIDCENLQPNDAVYLVWDMGRVWTGYPIIEVKGTTGTILDISYAEHLSDGRVNPAKSWMNYFDRMILGPNTLRHRITWPKCARYIQLYVHGGKVDIERIAWERSTYPVIRKGRFTSDNPVMDQAVEISLHTVQLCMEDSYMDTPWRERGSWLGDDLIKAQIAHSYFGDCLLSRRFLLHHARGQQENGMMQGKYPGNVTSHVSTWTLRFPPSVLEYCLESGDWVFGAQLWPNLKRIKDWITSLKTDHGLFQAPPVFVDERTNRYNFIDWAPIDMRGINAAWNAFAYECLRCIRQIACRLCKESDVKELDTLLKSHRESFQREFWDEKKGAFVNGIFDGKKSERWGCHENLLALLYDLADVKQSAQIIATLQRQDLFSFFLPNEDDYDLEIPSLGKFWSVSIARSKYRWPASKMVPIGTAYFAGYMLQALCKMGMVKDAIKLVESRWGEFSKQGATTVWETWSMSQSSLSHGWSSAPALFAARVILGVERLESTMDGYTVLPHVDDNRDLFGRVATKFGIVQVSWKKDILHVNLPEGVFLVGLPDLDEIFLDGILISDPLVLEKNRRRYLAVKVPIGSHRVSGKMDP